MCIKTHYRASYIYEKPNYQQYATTLQTSIGNVKKYFALLKKYRLVKRHGRHLQIISFKTCIELLTDIPDNQTIFLRIWKNRQTQKRLWSINTTLKQYQDLIHQELTLLNFKQQSFRKENPISIHRTKQGSVKSKENLNYGVVTGSKHLSKLLGCSIMTANRLLNQWNKLKFISRKVVQKTIEQIDRNGRLSSNFLELLKHIKIVDFGSLILDFSRLGSNQSVNAFKTQISNEINEIGLRSVLVSNQSLEQVTNKVRNINTMWAMM